MVAGSRNKERTEEEDEEARPKAKVSTPLGGKMGRGLAGPRVVEAWMVVEGIEGDVVGAGRGCCGVDGVVGGVGGGGGGGGGGMKAPGDPEVGSC